ncbi:unnamed protein product [marine sediment metagenome]|uniref:Uncharacterized protein n=1 Tax=marine sediment metagenome TaxID=412755 RepID=X1KCW7_9ZZZZ
MRGLPIKINPRLEGIKTNKTTLTPKDTVCLSSSTLPSAAREERRGNIAVDKAIAKIPKGNWINLIA